MTAAPVATVVVAAGGSTWESDVLREIETSRSMQLVRRCVDVAELLAVAPSAASAALVATELPGLDADAVFRLERDGVRVIGLGDVDRCRALGIDVQGEPGALEQAVADAGRPSGPEAAAERAGARTIAVWGPSGAPGRSTVAASLAASLAHRGHDTVLVDADTYGGSIAQMLAMLDEVSGLMAACRAANQGRVHEVSDHLLDVEPRLRLLSGIPRADMWPQVRPGALELVMRRLQMDADVIVADCASPIEPGEGAAGAGRNHVTRHVLSSADAVLVVGRADPVGLARLVRALHDLSDVVAVEPTVAVNLLRPSLGWSEQDVASTLTRLTGIEPATFIPADVSALDLAVMRGQLPRVAAPSSPFVAAVDDVAASLAPVIPSSLSS
ncbi:AAA family ATPase [Aeromicrobium sp.]|uniref:AAA family ATPase n=1 Tax=Aeromicrobium sp. TaxID=1871063 RepID=UPI003C4381B0